MPKSFGASQKSPSCLGTLVIVVLVMGCTAYASFSVFSRDLLWFWPYFEEQPLGMSLRCYGEKINLERGDPHFAEINALVNEQLSGDKQWNELPLTPETYQDYQTDPEMALLELYYSPPVSVHTGTAMFLDVDQLIVPLDARHANASVIFGLRENRPTGGSVHVVDTKTVTEYIVSQNLCPIK